MGLVLFVLAGCGGEDPEATVTVTGRFAVRQHFSDGHVEELPISLDGIPIEVQSYHPGELDDTVFRRITGNADGTFAAPDVPATGVRQVIFGTQFGWAFTGDHLEEVFEQFSAPAGRPFAEPGTMVSFEIGGLDPWQSSDSLTFFTESAQQYLAAPAMPSPGSDKVFVPALPYAGPLVDGDQGDRTICSQIRQTVSPAGVSYAYAIRAAELPAYRMTSGAETRVTGTLAPLSPVPLGVTWDNAAWDGLAGAINGRARRDGGLVQVITDPSFVPSGWNQQVPEEVGMPTFPPRTLLVASFTGQGPVDLSGVSFTDPYGKGAYATVGAGRFLVDYDIGPKRVTLEALVGGGVRGVSGKLAPSLGPARNLTFQRKARFIVARWDPPAVGTPREYRLTMLRWYPLFGGFFYLGREMAIPADIHSAHLYFEGTEPNLIALEAISNDPNLPVAATTFSELIPFEF